MSLTLPSSLAQPLTMDPEDRLYTHKNKPEWGVGLWVGEEQTRRRLVFQDGKQRAFKTGFYHLLEPVDVELVDVEKLVEQLAGDAEMIRAEEGSDAKPPVMSFDDQVAVFEHIYPQGFQTEDYVSTYRDPEDGRARKSQLGRVATLAQQILAEDAVKAMLEEGKHDDLHEALVQVLDATSLVSKARGVTPLVKLKGEDKINFAEAAADLLWGEDRFRVRFDRWVSVLNKLGIDVRWPLATVLPALLRPQKHVCVKRSVFDLQSREVRPDRPIRDKINFRRYRNARWVARAVRKRLDEASMPAQDMLDVRTFMWETLRPKGRKVLAEELNRG